MLHGHHSLPRFTENPTVCPYPLIPLFCSLYCNSERYSLILHEPRRRSLHTRSQKEAFLTMDSCARSSSQCTPGHAPPTFLPNFGNPQPWHQNGTFQTPTKRTLSPPDSYGQVSSVEDSSFSSSSTILVSRSTLSSFVYSVSNRKRHNPRVEHRPMSFEEG